MHCQEPGALDRAPTDESDAGTLDRASTDDALLDQTRYAQPALFVSAYALAQLWMLGRASAGAAAAAARADRAGDAQSDRAVLLTVLGRLWLVGVAVARR
jgi:hypothetical protein